MNLKRLTAAAAFLILICGPANATVYLTEDFNFSGALSANGWATHSGSPTNPIGTTTGLTFSGYPGSGIGNAALVDDTGQDDNRYLSSNITTGAAYASFMLRVNSSSAGYFFHLGQDNGGVMNTTNFNGRVFVTSDGTGDYELGLSFRNSTTPVTSGTDRTALNLTFGTTYVVVLKYQINVGADNDAVSLYVFSGAVPAVEPAPTLGPLLDFDAADGDLSAVRAVALRQYAAAQEQIVDGIVVSDTWAETVPVELVKFTVD